MMPSAVYVQGPKWFLVKKNYSFKTRQYLAYIN